MKSGIYRIYSIATGQSYYGSTRSFSARFAEHRYKWKRNSMNHKMRALFNQYGIANFKFEILEYCLPIEFDQKEKDYISNDKNNLNVWVLPFSSKGCNLGNHVKGKKFIGIPHTEESKKKFGEKIRDYYKKHDGFWKGKSIPEEMRKKVSLGLKEYYSKNNNANKGKSMSEESKKKVSESLKLYFAKNGSPSKGKVLSAETKLKISNSKKNRGVK